MSPVTEKPLSKAAQKSAERAARKADHIAKKAQEQLALQELRERARRLCSAPPLQFPGVGSYTNAGVFEVCGYHEAQIRSENDQVASPR